MKQTFPIIIFILLLASCRKAPSVVDKLKKDNKVDYSYFLYPSTMRMLNFGNIESLNKVVKNVEKARVFNMDIDSFSTQNMADLSTQLQNEEAYDLYLEMDGSETQFYILGKEKPAKTVFLTSNEGQHYVIDIDGRPDFLHLKQAWDDINSMDSTATVGFSMLGDLMNQENGYRERRRKRREKGERERREKEVALEAKRDSIRQDSIRLLD